MLMMFDFILGVRWVWKDLTVPIAGRSQAANMEPAVYPGSATVCLDGEESIAIKVRKVCFL